MLRQLVACLFCLVAMAGLSHARTLDDIRSSGVVTCGLDPAQPGLSLRDADLHWSGAYVDFCRALAGAVLGDAKQVNLVSLEPAEGTIALQSGEIDVLLPPAPLRSGDYEREGLMWVEPLFRALPPDVAIYAPVVRQGDDRWFLAVRSVIFELARAAGQGVTQEKATQELGRDPPATEVDETGGIALVKAWQLQTIAASGNLTEILARNFAGGSGLKLEGGTGWAPP